MIIKLTVEVGESKGSPFEDAKKVLLLAQKGIIEKYSTLLMSAGTIPPINYVSYGGIISTYIQISDTDNSVEVK